MRGVQRLHRQPRLGGYRLRAAEGQGKVAQRDQKLGVISVFEDTVDQVRGQDAV